MKFNVGDEVFAITNMNIGNGKLLNFEYIHGKIASALVDEIGSVSYYIEYNNIYEHLVFLSKEEMFDYVFKTEKKLALEHLDRLNKEEEKFMNNKLDYIKNY